jgi:hypothetical protein
MLRSVGEAHVCPLDRLPRVTTLEEEAEADQGECDGDRLRGGAGVLGGIGVHRNLMDEEVIAAG